LLDNGDTGNTDSLVLATVDQAGKLSTLNASSCR